MGEKLYQNSRGEWVPLAKLTFGEDEQVPVRKVSRDDWVVVHWNGSGGLWAGPYCGTWNQSLTRKQAEALAEKLQAESWSGWHVRAVAMTVGEYWDLLDESR